MYKCNICNGTGSRIQVATWKLVQCPSIRCAAHNRYLDSLEHEANEGYKMAKEMRYIDNEQSHDFKELVEAVNRNESHGK